LVALFDHVRLICVWDTPVAVSLLGLLGTDPVAALAVLE